MRQFIIPRLYSFSSIFFVLFTLSCAVPLQSTDKPQRERSSVPVPVESADIQIGKIAIIPFSSSEDYLAGELKGYISGKENFLTDTLYDELAARIGKQALVQSQDSASEFLKIRERNPNMDYRGIALMAGKQLGADAVLIGNISDYRERKGGKLGVDSPASVAFSVELLNVYNGQRIWEDYFAETQEALLQNVAEIKKFLDRGGKWITADALAKEGINRTADNLESFLITYSATNK